MKSNIGNFFLRLINKHFPPTHKCGKIFNRNTIKVSYSCPTSNQKLVHIAKKILNKPVNQNTRKCNSIKKNTCPLNGNRLLENILLIATITSYKKNCQPRNCKGISENIFKKQYANHNRSFYINRYKNDTKLSVDYWNLKAKNSNPKVTSAVKNQFSAYNPQSERCSLCLNKKLKILEDKENNLLNKKSELISKCRHQNKCML